MAPYVSKRQAAKFHAMEGRGQISHATVEEWDEATKRKRGGFKALPEKVGKPKGFRKGGKQRKKKPQRGRKY